MGHVRPVVGGVAVGVLALVGLLVTGTYPPAVGPVPSSVGRGLLAGFLAVVAVGVLVEPSVKRAAIAGLLTAGVGLVLTGAGTAVLSGGSGAVLVGVVLLASAVPAALVVVLGSTVTVVARTRLETATGTR